MHEGEEGRSVLASILAFCKALTQLIFFTFYNRLISFQSSLANKWRKLTYPFRRFFWSVVLPVTALSLVGMLAGAFIGFLLSRVAIALGVLPPVAPIPPQAIASEDLFTKRRESRKNSQASQTSQTSQTAPQAAPQAAPQTSLQDPLKSKRDIFKRNSSFDEWSPHYVPLKNEHSPRSASRTTDDLPPEHPKLGGGRSPQSPFTLSPRSKNLYRKHLHTPSRQRSASATDSRTQLHHGHSPAFKERLAELAELDTQKAIDEAALMASHGSSSVWDLSPNEFEDIGSDEEDDIQNVSEALADASDDIDPNLIEDGEVDGEVDGSADGSADGNAGQTDGEAKGNADGKVDGKASSHADGKLKSKPKRASLQPSPKRKLHAGGTRKRSPKPGLSEPLRASRPSDIDLVRAGHTTRSFDSSPVKPPHESPESSPQHDFYAQYRLPDSQFSSVVDDAIEDGYTTPPRRLKSSQTFPQRESRKGSLELIMEELEA